MNRREQILTILTVVVVGGALLFQFVLAPMLEGGGAMTTVQAGDLDRIRNTFRNHVEKLEKSGGIRQEFEQFGFSAAAADAGPNAGDIFRDELFELLTSRLGVSTPQISPADEFEIPNVEEYNFVEVEVQVSDTYPEIINLLRNMESRGLLIRRVKIEQRNRRDPETIELEVDVARLVKNSRQESRPRRGPR